ncbi:RNA polymerase sigma factor [Sphingopyxis fribergensis]
MAIVRQCPPQNRTMAAVFVAFELVGERAGLQFSQAGKGKVSSMTLWESRRGPPKSKGVKLATKSAKFARRRSMAAWVSEYVIPHEAAVRAWLARARASQEDIDELIQESYSRLAALKSVDHIDRPDAYFFSIARNLFVRRLRRAKVIPIESIAEIDSYQDDIGLSPEREASSRLDYRRVLALIDALPDRRRRIVRMRKLEGYSQREIAQALGISESVVENEIYQGVQAVQRAWRDSETLSAARLFAFESGERQL